MLDYDSALLGIRATIIGLMVAYAQEGAPALERAPEEFFTGEVNQGAWDGLISSVLQSEEFYEIHVYKVSSSILSSSSKQLVTFACLF